MSSPEFVDDVIGDFSESFTDIISANIIHDQYQFESKFDFDLKPHANESQKHYTVDLYFFIPKNMGIHPENYTRDHFYSDLTNLLRVQAPETFNWHKSNPSEWALPLADQYFAVHLSTDKRQRLLGSVVQEVKLFGCYLDAQLKHLQKSFLRIVERGFIAKQNWIEFLIKLIKNIQHIIQFFRHTYLLPIKNQMLFLDIEVRRAFLLMDEFTSYRVEMVFIQCSQILEKKNIHCPDVRNLLMIILNNEAGYRAENKIANLDWENNTASLETYYYRLGLLKKYALEALYLKSKNIKKERSYRNMIAAFGAALAAIWAGWADIQRFQWIGPTTGQEAWIRLLAIIILGMIAYIFKDRIKELTKEYFNQRLKQYLPDFDILMFYNYFNTSGEQQETFVGSCKEYFRYLLKNFLPPEIAYVRDIGNRSELDPIRDELIIHYSKKITLEVGQKNTSKLQFIRDIARFDFTQFLNKLDDPNKILSYFDRRKGIVTIEAPRVYHINLVIRYACSYQKDKTSSEYHLEYERVRIILNKQGIIRVEPVLARGDLNYLGNQL